MTDTTDAPYVVTLKAGASYDSPWIVVRGDTADEVKDRLRDLWSGEVAAAVVATASAFLNTWATEKGGPSPEGAVDNVVRAVSGTVVNDPVGNSPAPSTPAPQAAAAGVETDRWGNTYEHNHPKAPETGYGPKVLKRGLSREGNKPYAQWLDPRDPKIPSVYARREPKPVDLFDTELARGV